MKLQAKSDKLQSMPFTLKKILSNLLLPLPIGLILLVIGLGALIFMRARKTGITFMCSGIAILLLFSINPIANDLLIGLEKQYQPLESIPTDVKYIVVLGGGNGDSRGYPPNTQLSSASLARLIEAIRLYRQNPKSTLILSGGRVFGSSAEATVMNNTAIALGVERDHMKIEIGSRDTVEEAQHLEPLIKNQKFVLVTSAYHMPRAVKIFKEQGLYPIPAPTQFLIKHYQTNPKYYFPNVANLIHSEIALHEYIGIAWLYASRTLI